jgi:cytochrome c556
MSIYAFNLGPLAGMARGRMDYDAEVASAAATNLAGIAALDQDRYWVEGSSHDDLEESEALAAIWDDPTGFGERKIALQVATADLAAVAGNGLEYLQAAMGPVGQSCGGCHEDYRLSDN